MNGETHVKWHDHTVSRADREKLAGHAGCVIWFTGLSGCGKSTIANLVDRQLYQRNVHTMLLDGDNIRHGLNASPAMLLDGYGEEHANRFGLGFGEMDRCENIRRIAAVGQLFCHAGIVTLTAFVSPYRRDRDAARRHITDRGRTDDFIEVFVDTPLEVCEQRDPKGLYQRARAGEIKNFTGIDDPYETPESPELRLKTVDRTAEDSASEVVKYLESTGKIPARS